MPEESKEEYLARHRAENGHPARSEEAEELPVKKPTLRERLNTVFFLLLAAAFLYLLLQVFGMMKSN